MPRRDTKYRALQPAFCKYMTENSLWPIGKEYRDHMKRFHGGICGKVLTDIRAGAAVPEKALWGFFGLLRQRHEMGIALAQYHSADGRVPSPRHTIAQIMDITCGEVRITPTAGSTSVDFLRMGVRALWQLVALPGRPISKRSRHCATSELTEAVSWLFVYVAHCVSEKGTLDTLSFESARPIAQAWMGIDFDEYAHRVSEWRDHLLATVRLALGRKAPVGLTIVLPLTPEAYAAVREGHWASYECGPADFQVPSRHLLIECCAERVAGVQVESSNPTFPLLTSLLIQLAQFAALHESDDDADLRLLSFAGTDESRIRLAKQHFKVTGNTMPRSGVAIMERIVSQKSLVDIDAITIMLFYWVSRIVQR